MRSRLTTAERWLVVVTSGYVAACVSLEIVTYFISWLVTALLLAGMLLLIKDNIPPPSGRH